MVDPTISIGHNVQTLLLNDNSLPPDLKWEQSVENEATRVAQIAMFDNQVCKHNSVSPAVLWCVSTKFESGELGL